MMGRAAYQEPWRLLAVSIAAFRLKLWDEERGCLVRYPPRANCPETRPDAGPGCGQFAARAT